MMSSIASSMMARRPRAPELRRMASRAMARSDSLVKLSFTFSISNIFWYCFTSAFFGWVRMVTRSSSRRSLRVATTGSRPTNSGIIPNFIRSSGSTRREQLADAAVVLVGDLRAEAQPLLAHPASDDVRRCRGRRRRR